MAACPLAPQPHKSQAAPPPLVPTRACAATRAPRPHAEAGEGEDGRMKSAIGIGALLMDGLGDTIRVSLTEDPEYEIDPCSRLAELGNKAASQVRGRGRALRGRAGVRAYLGWGTRRPAQGAGIAQVEHAAARGRVAVLRALACCANATSLVPGCIARKGVVQAE